MNHQRGRAKRHAPTVVTATRGLLKRPICVVWRRRPGVPAVPGRAPLPGAAGSAGRLLQLLRVRPRPAPLRQSADGFSFWTPNLARVEAFAARMLRSPHLFVPDDLWISLYLQNEGSPSPACSTPCRPVSSSESDRPIGTAARSARRAPSSVARDARGGHRSWAVRGRSA
jgi:hypothetical protein